jgi:hypothetical protein
MDVEKLKEARQAAEDKIVLLSDKPTCAHEGITELKIEREENIAANFLGGVPWGS